MTNSLAISLPERQNSGQEVVSVAQSSIKYAGYLQIVNSAIVLAMEQNGGSASINAIVFYLFIKLY